MQQDNEDDQGDAPVQQPKADATETMENAEKAEKQLTLADPAHPIQQKIDQENQKYWHGKYLFAHEYFDFVSEVAHFWDTGNIVAQNALNKNNDAHLVGYAIRPRNEPGGTQNDLAGPSDEVYDLRAQHADNPQKVLDAAHEVFKFATGFYLTILQRAQAKSLVPKLVNALKAYLNNDPRNGLWLLNEVSNWEIIKEMLLQPQGPEMPKLTVGLIYGAMLTTYETEKGQLNQHWTELEQHQKSGSTEPCP